MLDFYLCRVLELVKYSVNLLTNRILHVLYVLLTSIRRAAKFVQFMSTKKCRTLTSKLGSNNSLLSSVIIFDSPFLVEWLQSRKLNSSIGIVAFFRIMDNNGAMYCR